MASYRNIVLIALFFLIATPLRARGATIGSGDVAKVQAVGLLSCSVLPGQPTLPRVSVNITCNGGTVTLGQAVTDTAGFLNATFNIAEGVLFDASTCVAAANVSGIASCRVVAPTGILRVSLVLVNIVQRVALLVTGLILG